MLSCPQNHWAMAVWSSGHAGESLSSFSYYPWMTDTVDTVCRESQKLRVCASATKNKLGYIMYNSDMDWGMYYQ